MTPWALRPRASVGLMFHRTQIVEKLSALNIADPSLMRSVSAQDSELNSALDGGNLRPALRDFPRRFWGVPELSVTPRGLSVKQKSRGKGDKSIR